MRMPGPDHPITIVPFNRHVTVLFGGEVIAETDHALELKEATLAPVLYVPRGDAHMALLERTDHGTLCPYKGDASYFTISAGGKRSENAVWSYEAPYPAMAQIEGHLAFYPKRVDAIEIG
jgi:uncharacterized protein (DUF427 family)